MAKKKDNNPQVEVEAVPIETGLSQYEGFIAETRDLVAGKLAEYESIKEVSTGEAAKDVRRYRADLNNTIKEVRASKEERIGALRRAIREIDAAVTAELSPLDARQAELGAMLDAYADGVKQRRYEALEKHYTESYPALAEVVPYERIDGMHRTGEGSFYAAKVSGKKAIEMLDQHVDLIAQDEAAIETFDLTEAERAELKADYFACLNLAEATRRGAERKRRAEAEEAERERVRKLEADRAAAAITQKDVAAAADADAERIRAEIAARKGEQAPAPERWRVTAEGIVEGGLEKVQNVIKLIKGIGLTGTAQRVKE